MPILKLHLENVGPFDALELDFTDGKGNAHLGPHILTGVNGSGKTTVLKAIAWCLSTANSGFDVELWEQFLASSEAPRAQLSGMDCRGTGFTLGRRKGDKLHPPATFRSLGCVGAYSPSPVLRRLEQPGAGNAEQASTGWLSFGRHSTNEHIQQFWVAALSKEALASAFGEQAPNQSRAAVGLRRAIQEILGEAFEPSLNLNGPFPLPSLRLRGMELNFSQLAAGFNASLAWLVDFLLRQEYFHWGLPQMEETRPGILLIDEIDTHLHPQWQRRILNGIRAAFPNTQIIVTTHSPFVVTSCEEARVHVLQVDEHGKAFLAETIDRPDGSSIAATIHGVFGIKGRFGPEVEELLTEWNDLKKRDHFGKLNAKEKSRLRSLVKQIAARGEELASLVHDPVLSSDAMEELLALAGPAPKRR